MRLLILESIISVVYVFDVSAYPFVHVPFYLLTILYFGSILELIGIFKLAKFVSRRLRRAERMSGLHRLLGPVSLAFHT